MRRYTINNPTNFNFSQIKKFIQHNFRHFNAAVVTDAAEAYVNHIKNGGKMMVALAGAMSTAELGITLAEMIRKDKIHAISCTGANLEEDVFNLIANNRYKRVPHYRELSAKDEEDLLLQKMNRVTDTCIPEDVMRLIEKEILVWWQNAEKENKRYFPYEFMFQLVRSGVLKQNYQIDEKDSWVVAASEKNIPIFVPGWEDSTIGNVFVSQVRKKNLNNFSTVKSGLETMDSLIDWYLETSKDSDIGFFQIGGGIAGDFSICVVPLIRQDLLDKSCKLWAYFCQISDSTTSYGSYSGAVPNEKITWEKLSAQTPRFIIESDATIVAPLMFAYILTE
jgi:deoxyhypusine synthase